MQEGLDVRQRRDALNFWEETEKIYCELKHFSLSEVWRVYCVFEGGLHGGLLSASLNYF